MIQQSASSLLWLTGPISRRKHSLTVHSRQNILSCLRPLLFGPFGATLVKI